MIKEYNFDEFEKTSKKEWSNKLVQDLGAESAQRISDWKCQSDLSLSAYYNQEDLKNDTNSSITAPSEWKYLQSVGRNDSNKEILNALMNGAEGIIIEGDLVDDLDRLLNEVAPQHCTLALKTSSINEYKKFLTWRKNNHPGNVKGDLLVFHDSKDIESLISDEYISCLEEMISLDDTGHSTININCGLVQSGGGRATTELASMLSQCVFLLNHFIDKGYSVERIANSLFVSTTIGSSYFLELSKVRVMRMLLTQLLKAYGVNDVNIPIHAATSPLTKTALDSNTNFLRCTSEAMSAVLGGVDYLSINPQLDLPSADRIARNISNLLKDESYLSRIADPAAGSYYMERLSMQLAQEAWTKFQEIESDGGFLTAVENKIVQKEIKEEYNYQVDRISSGRRKLVGVNDFGNADEKITSSQLNRSYESLSSDFESVRKSVETFVGKNNEESRPRVYLAAVGTNAKMINARYTFVTNFFNWAGFKVEKLEMQSELNTTSLIVCCGADQDYNKDEIQKINHLEKVEIFLAAGSVQSDASPLLTGWINAKSNRLKTIVDILNQMGITQNSSLS